MTRLKKASTLNLPTLETEIAYLACLIDTEGSVILLRNHRTVAIANRVTVNISNTDRDLMDWLAEIGGCVYATLGTRKPCWRWQVTAREDVIALLRVCIPHMKIKRELARSALDHALSQTRGGST